jgi:hypothetical protein
LICALFDIDQAASFTMAIQHCSRLDKIALSSVTAHGKLKIPLRGAFTGQPDVPSHGKHLVRDSAFQGRCFGRGVAKVKRPRDWRGIGYTRLAPALQVSNPAAPTKASSGQQLGSLRAVVDEAHEPVWAAPRYTSSDHQSRADPALVRRLEQGARESDGQEHANRGNLPRMALGLVQHRRGWQMEKVNLPWSPCRSYGQRVY